MGSRLRGNDSGEGLEEDKVNMNASAPTDPYTARARLFGGNRMKLGVMAFNCSHGSTITTVPEAWQLNWPDTRDIAQAVDRSGMEALLPVGRWKGYGGPSNFNNCTFESFTWASAIGAVTSYCTVLATVHVPLVHPLMVAKMAATVDHVTGGRVFSTNGEVELYVPPNAWPADQIVRIVPLEVPEGGLPGARRPLAAWTVLADDPTLDKPATLSMELPPGPVLPAGLASEPLASAPTILRLVISGADTTLVPVGGSKSADGTRVTTTVDELGTFVLVDATPLAGAGFEGARDLDCQPRVLSPRGGGFDTRTAISFELGKPSTGAVKVYDRAGRLVKEVAESSEFLAGQNVVFWDGTDGDGQVVPSGLYTVAVRFDGETSVRTVVVANR